MKKLRPAHEVKSKNPRLGYCYELSGNYVARRQDCILVHGTIQGCGYPPNPHAWVILPDGMIHDPVGDVTLTADAYTRIFSAVEQVRYTYVEMARHALRAAHWGPWHEQDQERSA